MSNDKDNYGPGDSDAAREFFESMQKQKAHNERMNDIGIKSMSDGYSDVADSIHLIYDEINRSESLNVAAMLAISRTFDAVFKAFATEADSSSVEDDEHRKFISSCGIVAASNGECPGCAPGSILLHDLQVAAGFAAMRFFLFARLRKIETAIPILEADVDEHPERVITSLREVVLSAGSLVDLIKKMGFDIREDHPISQRTEDGIRRATALMVRGQQIIRTRKEKGEG
jgi:hypothetical protein